MTKETLEVGDIIQVTPRIGRPYKLKIARTTKTLAISEPINTVGATFRFKRSCKGWISRIGDGAWNTTTYDLIEDKNNPELLNAK